MTSEDILRNFSIQQLKGIIEANEETIKRCQEKIYEAQMQLNELTCNVIGE